MSESYYDRIIKLRVNAVLVLLIILCFFGAAYSYFGGLDKQYDFTPQTIEMVTNMTIADKTVKVDFLSQPIFHTNSLSAQNPITVTMNLSPNTYFTNKDYSWSDLPPSFEIMLDNADQQQCQFLIFDCTLNQAVITVNKIDNPPHYYGVANNVVYQFEGKYGYFIITPNESSKAREGKPVLFNSDQTAIRETNTFIPIGSSSETALLKTNDIFISLTLVLIAFGTFELRDLIIDYMSRHHF